MLILLGEQKMMVVVKRRKKEEGKEIQNSLSSSLNTAPAGV